MFRFYGFVGLVSVLSAYTIAFFKVLPYGPESVILNNFLLMAGLWLFFDAVDFKLNKTSLLHKIRRRSKILIYVISIGVITGVFVEYFGAFVSDLWWEPFYTYIATKPAWQAILIFFSTAIAIAYVMLFPVVYSVYRVLNHFLKENKAVSAADKNLNGIFMQLGIIGFIFIIIPLPAVMFFSMPSLVRGLLFVFPLFGLWFLLEYVEYTQHKRSLMMDLMGHRKKELVAISLTSVLIGLMVEGLNLLAPAWNYKNFPFGHVQIFGVPVIILVGWIPLIIIFLSFYRVFFKENDVMF